MKYLFILGNAPDLAAKEVEVVLGEKASQKNILPNVLLVETDLDLTDELLNKLGGTIKVAKIEDKDLNDDKISENISDLIQKLGWNPADFGLSFYGLKPKFFVNKEIKKLLADEGVKSRFVLPKFGETELSSVVVQKQKLAEFLLVQDGDTLILGITFWVQDFEGWNKRDYGRPEVEAHIGMLPPKVARQMINISGAKTILDPFCGVGTILMEALTIGLNAMGSDVDVKQVERTRKNIEWIGKNAELLVSDSRRVSLKFNNIDAIVTEPDLGPNSKNAKVDISKLQNLYVQSLEDWKNVLKPNGKVVIVLPSFDSSDRLVKNVVDKARSIGYILESGPYKYARLQAKVVRNIVVFKYGTH